SPASLDPGRDELLGDLGSQRTGAGRFRGPRSLTPAPVLRVARPTDRLEDVVRFYTIGLGLAPLGEFRDHEGFDGVMLGVPGGPYHLEFIRRRGHIAGRAPTEDNLLVFYLPDPREWQAAVDRMIAAGYPPVPAFNPYWERAGR